MFWYVNAMELVEVVWDIFSDLINDFFFELNNRLLNLMVHGMSGRLQSRKYGRHRSLVRLIGTALPLKPCQRTYSSLFYSEHKHDTKSSLDSESPYPRGGSRDFEAWSQELKSNAPDVISSIKFSTPKEEHVENCVVREVSAEKFAALEEQVLQLQADIAKILNAQLMNPSRESTGEGILGDKLSCLQSHKSLDSDYVSSTTSIAELPVPPPPPPPLPPFSLPSRPLIRSQSLTDQINQHSKSQLNSEPSKYHHGSTLPPSMGEVLKNLGTVKLRHVERSPGGTPVRRRPLSPPRNDPAALLAAALRRRFARMRPDESSPERVLLNNSNHEKSFESMDHLSYTLSPQDINKLGTLKI